MKYLQRTIDGGEVGSVSARMVYMHSCLAVVVVLEDLCSHQTLLFVAIEAESVLDLNKKAAFAS